MAAGIIYKYRDAEGRILLTDNPRHGRGMALLKRFHYNAKPMSGGSVPSLPRLKENISRFSPLIHKIASDMGLDPALIHAVILAESAYDPKALSPKGAMGLMQLMPATAERFGVRDAYDPVQNIRGGTRYLKWLMERFGNNLELVVAAYNAGEGAVEKYGRTIPPYKETRAYVKRVKEYMARGMLAFN
ncbi:MAG TPA: lytic transglycosylase domain-containing protein [Chromatiaceae bacterium]|nr:lytic transglycosylase domain-containing protein [Chromatiaceae bacterium]